MGTNLQTCSCNCWNLTSAGFYQPEFRANLRLNHIHSFSLPQADGVSLQAVLPESGDSDVWFMPYGLDLSVLISVLCPHAMIPHLASVAFEGNLCTMLLIFYHKTSTWNSCYLANVHQ